MRRYTLTSRIFIGIKNNNIRKKILEFFTSDKRDTSCSFLSWNSVIFYGIRTYVDVKKNILSDNFLSGEEML